MICFPYQTGEEVESSGFDGLPRSGHPDVNSPALMADLTVDIKPRSKDHGNHSGEAF